MPDSGKCPFVAAEDPPAVIFPVSAVDQTSAVQTLSLPGEGSRRHGKAIWARFPVCCSLIPVRETLSTRRGERCRFYPDSEQPPSLRQILLEGLDSGGQRRMTIDLRRQDN